MTSSNVPKFGDWESEENVPYTAYFEKARKVRTSCDNKITKPQDPEEETSHPKPEHEEQVKTGLDPGETSGNKKHGTGRSKPRSNLKGDECPEKDVVVPKFGDWDENNPGSAGYTGIFDKVREERTSGSNVPSSSRTPTQSSSQKTSDRYKFCCFSWGGK